MLVSKHRTQKNVCNIYSTFFLFFDDIFFDITRMLFNNLHYDIQHSEQVPALSSLSTCVHARTYARLVLLFYFRWHGKETQEEKLENEIKWKLLHKLFAYTWVLRRKQRQLWCNMQCAMVSIIENIIDLRLKVQCQYLLNWQWK